MGGDRYMSARFLLEATYGSYGFLCELTYDEFL